MAKKIVLFLIKLTIVVLLFTLLFHPQTFGFKPDKFQRVSPGDMLNELRQARGLSQKMLAEVLQVQQPSIAKLEKRTDMYLSTLRSHIEAMGGQLEVIARFPDGAVRISNFAELGCDRKLTMGGGA